MDHNRLVDLLLVRLSREEEKKKVIDLLVSELGMSVEEAREKVDNSPSILNEGVSMEQARILQDRMYPFVDLLPRHYQNKKPDKEAVEATRKDESFREDTPNENPPEEEVTETLDSEDWDDNALLNNQSSEKEEASSHRHFDEADDDSLIITSAAEEMLTVERCHICGRTPTGDHKLIPCRTCGELTCSECYNRNYHVCEKCASEGKGIDRPLDSIPDSRANITQERSYQESTINPRVRTQKTAKPGLLSKPSTLLISIVALVLVIAAFFIIDPLGLFVGPADSPDEMEIAYSDTSVVNAIDSLNSDSVIDTALVRDTLTTRDSLLTDTLNFNGFISLRDISLPDSMEISEGYSLPKMLTSSPLNNIEIQTDSMQFLIEPLGQLATAYSIEFDGFSLVRTDEGFDILVMSILHPEPAEKRAAFLGNLGSMLDSTMVDQMVLYYRENQYYEPNLFSFTADSFSILSRSSSPYFLQRKQSSIPETTELVTGSIFEWMTDIN